MNVTSRAPTPTVPDVTTIDVERGQGASCAKAGLANLTVTPDYRDDVDPGTVDEHQPGGVPARAQDRRRSSSSSPPTRT